jgi:hypothetical protein
MTKNFLRNPGLNVIRLKKNSIITVPDLTTDINILNLPTPLPIRDPIDFLVTGILQSRRIQILHVLNIRMVFRIDSN